MPYEKVKPHEETCICGKTFMTVRGTYCSEECYQANYYKKHLKVLKMKKKLWYLKNREKVIKHQRKLRKMEKKLEMV